MILAVGWLLFVLYAYPGLMTMDSFDQLREGRAWFFTDAHPPIMATIWGVLDHICSGPFGMLALQSTCFLAGAYLLLCRAMGRTRAAIFACVVLVMPPVLAPMAVIWKDCVMAGVLVLGIPAVLAERRWVRIVGLVLFVIATALRYNALAATFPLVIALFEWNAGQRWLVRYSIATGTWLVVVVLALGLNAALTDKQLHYWHSSSALADITGVLAKVEPDIPDAELRPLLAPTGIKVDTDIHAKIRAAYRPYDFQQLISGEGNLWDVPTTEPMPGSQRDAIQHAWTTLVTGHLGAYARYRFDVFAETLGLHRKFRGATVVTHRGQYPGMLEYMGIAHRSWRFQDHLERWMLWTAKHTPLFLPHLYLWLALLLLPFAQRHRDILALLLSGIAMELTLIPLGWTPDFRFSHWLVVCTCLSIVMLISRRAAAASE
jgi:hypothetical protein